jgi:MarR family transcriptional regulator, transcriptional regulator for hemolysin
MDVTAIHAVRPSDIFSKLAQHSVDITRVKALIQAANDDNISIHLFSSLRSVSLRIYICTYISQCKSVQQEASIDTDVLLTPGHLISLAARGFARLSEARLKPIGFGLGQVPVLVALQNGQASTQKDLARFAKIEQPPMAQMLARMERDGLIQRERNPSDGRSSRVTLTDTASASLPNATAVLLQGNRDAMSGFSEEETQLFVTLLGRLIANLDRLSEARTTTNVSDEK